MLKLLLLGKNLRPVGLDRFLVESVQSVDLLQAVGLSLQVQLGEPFDHFNRLLVEGEPHFVNEFWLLIAQRGELPFQLQYGPGVDYLQFLIEGKQIRMLLLVNLLNHGIEPFGKFVNFSAICMIGHFITNFVILFE